MAEASSPLRRAAVEFLVIVTGILAAFWVEEYRDARAVRALEREYVERIAADLDDAVVTLASGLENARQRADAGRAVLAHISGTAPVSSTRLILGAYEVGLYPIARERRLGRRTTYDELVSTGNLRTVGDFSLRHSLARYYEEYTRVGGRLEDRPLGWRVWVYGLLSPGALAALRRVEGCFSESPDPTLCEVDLPPEDEQRFARELSAKEDVARAELHQMVHYQDRQIADLEGFLDVTRALRQDLSNSGLAR